MKLFFKHLLNSIKKRPLQPFILTFTIVLAVLVCTVSINLGRLVSKETDSRQVAQYGNADFTISINSDTESRFMFTKTVEEILGSNAKVSGVFELPMFFESTSDSVFGLATDFYNVNQVFDLEFFEYSKITSATLNDCALVSRAFIDKFNLSLGDTFTVKLLGHQKTFTIAGVTEAPFLTSYDVLVNVTGVMRLLSADSLLAAAIGEDFKPCNTIYVSVNQNSDVNECMSLLKKHSEFSDKTFTVVTDTIKISSNFDALNIIIWIITALALLLSVAVIFCCFYIISTQRTDENAQFIALGTPPKKLYAIQFAEILIYFIIGFPIGTVLAYPLTAVIHSFVGFKLVSAKINALSIILSGLLVLFISLLTVLIFILIERRLPKKRVNRNLLIPIIAGLFVISLVLLFISPYLYKFAISCASAGLLFFLLFFGIPPLIKKVINLLDNSLMRKVKGGKQQATTFSYALKNVNKVSVLQNSCRLLTIILTIVLTVTLAITSSNIVSNNYRTQINGDYLILNATESCKQNLQDVNSIENVYSIYFGNSKYNDQTQIPLIGASSINAISNKFNEDKLPKDDCAFLSVGLAKILNVKVGDKLDLLIGEKTITVKIADIHNDTINVMIFNNLYFDIPYNVISVNGKTDVDSATLLSDLSKATALEMTAIVSTEDYLSQKLQVSELYVQSGYVLLPLMACFAIIGFLDNLTESYRSRRDEYALFNLAGMSKKRIRLMKFFELLSVFSLSIVLGVISLSLTTLILDQGLKTFGYSLLFSLFFG